LKIFFLLNASTAQPLVRGSSIEEEEDYAFGLMNPTHSIVNMTDIAQVSIINRQPIELY
jgi:hypothetical protein